MASYVYKYVLNDEIIYIGKNDTDLYSRLNQHGKPGDNIEEYGWDEINQSTIYYIELANSTMSDVVESELIRRYKPKYNKAKNSEWDGLSFVEPKWKICNSDMIKKNKKINAKQYDKYKPDAELQILNDLLKFENTYYEYKDALKIARNMKKTKQVVKDIKHMEDWLQKAEPVIKSINKTRDDLAYMSLSILTQ